MIDASKTMLESTIVNAFEETVPYMLIGRPKTIHMLNMLVPIMLPTAISNSSFLAAFTVIVSSGREVPITMAVIDIIFWLIPKTSASITALSTTMSEDTIIPMSVSIIKIIDFFRLYSGISVSSFLFFLTNPIM